MKSGGRLHICHFSSVHNQNDTRVFYRECVWLAHDFEVTLIAIGRLSGKKDGVTLVGLPKPASRIKRMLHTTREVYRLAKAADADIYHFHDPELIPFAWLLKRRGKQVVYDIHENVTESLKEKRWLPLKGLFTWLYRRFESIAARHFHFVLAEHSYEKVYHRRYPNKAVTLVRNFAPEGLFAPFVQTQRAVQGNTVRIFYMGSIEAQYCYAPMLEAIALLNSQGVNAHLTMIGWFDENTRQAIDKLPFIGQLQDKVTLTGFMEMEAGYALSRECNLGFSFVSDNLNVSQSFPRKMYEYMHIGLPVISSGHALYKNMVETHALGVCVNTNTGAEIAQAVKQLMQSGDYLNTLAQNNLKAARGHFRWEDEYHKLQALYRQLSGS